ncbi:MAG: UDP-2,3-diacylglucosamine diphosphatase [Pirellulaceae bacterium]
MSTRHGRSRRRSRTLFVSDLHLGSRHCRAEAFLAFIETQRPDQIYLVGDIIDGWRLRQRWHWTPTYSRVISKLLDLADEGVQIYYAAGNHDEFLRPFLRDFRVFELADEFIHEAVDGRRMLVVHGDKFDVVEKHSAWLSWVGAVAYDTLMSVQSGVNAARRLLGCEPVQFCGWVKRQVKSAVTFVSDFRNRLAHYARDNGCQGVVCGHIHTPQREEIDGIAYFNTGDWVENCTALVEFSDGSWELQHLPWSQSDVCRVEWPRPARLPDDELAPDFLPAREPIAQEADAVFAAT